MERPIEDGPFRNVVLAIHAVDEAFRGVKFLLRDVLDSRGDCHGLQQHPDFIELLELLPLAFVHDHAAVWVQVQQPLACEFTHGFTDRRGRRSPTRSPAPTASASASRRAAGR